jgi:hypothetical protein
MAFLLTRERVGPDKSNRSLEALLGDMAFRWLMLSRIWRASCDAWARSVG